LDRAIQAVHDEDAANCEQSKSLSDVPSKQFNEFMSSSIKHSSSHQDTSFLGGDHMRVSSQSLIDYEWREIDKYKRHYHQQKNQYHHQHYNRHNHNNGGHPHLVYSDYSPSQWNGYYDTAPRHQQQHRHNQNMMHYHQQNQYQYQARNHHGYGYQNINNHR